MYIVSKGIDPSDLIVFLLLELLLKLLDLLLQVLEFLGELLEDRVSLHTVFGTEGGSTRPVI